MDAEHRYAQLRQTAAAVGLTRDQVWELIEITDELAAERRRLRLLLFELRQSFAEVRSKLNEISGVVSHGTGR